MKITEYEAKIKAQMITDLNAMTGKMIRYVLNYDSEIYIAFEDNMFAVLTYNYEWEDVNLVLEHKVNEISPGALVKLDLMTENEAADLHKLRVKSGRDAYRARERKEYERLKAQFEQGN